jgi:hypothetical protein
MTEPSYLWSVTVNDTWATTATARDGTEATAIVAHLWTLHTGRDPKSITARKLETLAEVAESDTPPAKWRGTSFAERIIDET